jgi:3',5'-cyclic AMP phosphodiesterase CpdA
VKIALISDTHLSARAPQFNANWDRALEWIADGCFEAVIHLGDITADAIMHPEELQFARDRFERLGETVRFLPGNHDIGDNPSSTGIVPEHPLDSRRVVQYHDAFGPDSWWFRAQQWQCIGLNAQLFGTETDLEARQDHWLQDVVARDDGPLALFLHKPLFRDDWEDTEAHSRYVPHLARQRLKALLPAGRLRLVVSGHAHQTRRVDCEGAAHIWMPSTAFCIPDALQERLGQKVVGIAVLELTADTADLRYFTPPGMIRHNLLEIEDLYPKLDQLDPALRRATL